MDAKKVENQAGDRKQCCDLTLVQRRAVTEAQFLLGGDLDFFLVCVDPAERPSIADYLLFGAIARPAFPEHQRPEARAFYCNSFNPVRGFCTLNKGHLPQGAENPR